MTAGLLLTNHLRHHREHRGWTQLELSHRSGISRSEISSIENGRLVPSTTAALAISHALGVSVEKIFSIGSTAAMPAEWAWGEPHEIFWEAEVGGRLLRFPMESLASGFVPGDGPSSAAGNQTLVIASCDPSAPLFARMLEREGVRPLIFQRSSRAALELLKAGRVHLAGIHLGEDSRRNIAEARKILGRGHRFFTMATWEESLVFSTSRAGGRVSSRGVEKLRWVGREEGSGARRCSDMILGEYDKMPRGYNRHASGHRGVVEALRAGWAEVGVCLRYTAEEAGLPNMVVSREAFDLCTRDDFARDPRILVLLKVLRSRPFREAMGSLPGYDVRSCGDEIRERRGSMG